MDAKAIEKLADAVWHVLDDMGKDGCECSTGVKAMLRVAFEPFTQAGIKNDPLMEPDCAPEYTFDEAAALLKELGL